ncbi:ABC transporter ATP-binding protein [Mucilaginibacter sp. PAMB04168]|uniref:ABC transporter ATP-binding protein n=1 Tax=Mucilaginibacter sp. PAMB04168 TaxID=3138567 RepID=UPI0031F62DC0
MSIAIKAENLSKAYQLGEFSTGTLSRDIQRRIALMRGKEDPYLKIGQTNDRTIKGTSDIVWSLKDINFEIGQGDAVGIIGRNGAGKSTLLKVLSRVTTPTTGSVKIKGRVASLLEVGTGFHPELTGRENIFLNGAILGMRKHEIKKHFDAIVDFAGVERYIDTPVKRYSSGMYVRLAFAVAAHLESEILIVDEVLAVGDAEFQKKCLGKMNDVSKGEGRTVLFVSHNMSSISQLCKKGILLQQGNVLVDSDVHETLKTYMSAGGDISSYFVEANPIKRGQFISAKIYNESGELTNVFQGGTKPYIELEYVVNEDYLNFNVGVLVKDAFETHIYSNADTDLDESLLHRKKGRYKVVVPIDIHNLNTGNYKVQFLMGIVNIELFDLIDLTFSIEHDNFLNTGARPGLLISINKWHYQG